MEAIKIDLKMSDEQKKYREECIQKCLRDRHIQAFLEQFELDEAFVREHSSQLWKWAENKKICENCHGLDECHFDHGKVFELMMDDHLLCKTYSKCRYLKEEEKKYQYLKNYMYFHGNEEMKLREFKTMDKTSDSIDASKILMESMHQRKGVFLCGRPGVGKTYLMNALGNAYVKDGKKVAFVNLPTLMSELKNGFTEVGLIDHILSILKKCDVLILDDIGGESITGWSRDEILMPLLNERMEMNKKTYFTSNYNFEELENHFSIDSRGNKDAIKANRLIQRVKALSDEKILKGMNRRL